MKDILFFYKMLVLNLILCIFKAGVVILSIILSPLGVVHFILMKDKDFMLDILQEISY